MVATLLDPAGLAGLAQLLDAANLPSADLAGPGRLFFRFEADNLVGYGGVEGEGSDRLLRSIVVLADRRGHGLGRTLVVTLERQARDFGVQRLHLLTTTAAPFFRTLGYADSDRGAAPPAVAASREFTALCPASAVYLVKAL
ncbi:GNAT family N-acetyltransferase [Sphingomonas sp. RHCKR7]|jgi:amino-acid N-acetyltransferase|nr:arsenic resistance N-acetyltransferase ArsN2 [Sphingomonas folli]MBW6525718.1 GNAT family N-acetyltransferase [Sphingomonas folli]